MLLDFHNIFEIRLLVNGFEQTFNQLYFKCNITLQNCQNICYVQNDKHKLKTKKNMQRQDKYLFLLAGLLVCFFKMYHYFFIIFISPKSLYLMTRLPDL